MSPNASLQYEKTQGGIKVLSSFLLLSVQVTVLVLVLALLWL